MFNHQLMPEVSVSEMRGVLALLDLISNSKSKAATDFLHKLHSEKEAATKAAADAARDRAAADAALDQATKLHEDVDKRMTKAVNEANLKSAMIDDKNQKVKEDQRVLAERLATHKNDVDRYAKEYAARQAELLRRENALAAREEKFEKDAADLQRRRDEFNKIVAAVGQVAS